MAIYTQKCEQKCLKINNSGGWNKNVLGGKNGKVNNLRGGGGGRAGENDYSRLESTCYNSHVVTNIL